MLLKDKLEELTRNLTYVWSLYLTLNIQDYLGIILLS